MTLPPLVFLGSGSFGVPVLQRLADEDCVKLVISQPDRPAGRGAVVTQTPVSQAANALGVPLICPEDCNADNVRAVVRSTGAKVMVVIAYGQKLGSELLDGMFAINLHGSLLPAWRGAAPYQRALMAGDAVAGVTVIAVAERMDAGAVFGSAQLEIGPRMTAGELHDALSALGPPLIQQVLADWQAGTAKGVAQDESRATRARKLSRADAYVDFGVSARQVRARINGLSPWPACLVNVAGLTLKVLRAEECAGAGAPGELLADGAVACASGAVRFLEVQAAGGKVMPFDAWCRGRQVNTGEIVSSQAPAQA